MSLGKRLAGLMTPANGTERENYIAECHVKYKRLNLPKFEIRKFSVEEKRVWCSGVY